MKPTELITVSAILTIALTGCATFQPKPISPEQTAAAFEARSLANAGLKKFMEINLRHAIAPWPPNAWTFPMLTLVAFYYHPDLDLARAKWRAAEAAIITAGGRPNPTVGFTPEFNANTASKVSPWIFSPTFDLPIETAGKRGYRVAEAEQLSEAARLAIAGAAWQVRSRLRRRFLDLYMAIQKQALLEKQQTDQEEIVKVLEQRLEAGEASEPDVTQARIALRQTTLGLRDAQKQSAEARVRVADALGLPVEALDHVALSFDIFDHVPPIRNLPRQNVQRQALLGRPDISAALAEYAASQSDLQLAIAKQYPDIHLGPGYKWDQGDNKWSFGISLTLPIFNQNQGPIAEAEVRRKKAAVRFAALQAGIIGEVDRSLAGYGVALQKLATADALVAEQKKQLQSAEELFKAGAADRVALGGALLELDAIEIARSDTLVTAQQSLGRLEDSMQHPIGTRGFPANLETDPRSEKGNTE
ncbi:MAG: TolC family protein [Alphaproteobacteria bacterium]